MASIITSRTLAIARRRPQWPICLNRDDSRAKGLRSWYPLFPNIKGKNLIRPGEWELEAQSATTWETDAEMGYVARTSGTDNSNYEAQHATSPAEGADDLTIACWYYPIAHEDDYGIIVGRSLYLHPFLLQVYGSSIEGVRFGLRTTTSRYVIASDSVTVGKWQRLVCTYDHNYVRLYVNGVECGTPVADTEDIEISANQYLLIGSRETNASQANMRICDTLISSRAWSSAGVAADYDPKTRWDHCHEMDMFQSRPRLG